MQKTRQIDAIYPLSPMQQGMLFHTIYAPDSGVYFHQVRCVLEGELNVSSLREAWQRVLDRHAVLRTAFVWEHRKQPLQVVHPQVPLPWVEEDWRELSPPAQQERVAAYLERDRRTGFVLSKAPLLRCALLRTGDNAYEFIWSYHHILLDGWSLALLLKEVFAHYAALERQGQLELPRPRPYQDYIAWLKRQSFDDAEKFWRHTLRGVTAPTPLALARSHSNGTGTDDGEVQLELSSELTTALNALAARHKLTVNTMVQGGWALLLSRYSGEREVVYGATVSGRPADLPGIETMIGLFINTLPVRVSVSGDELLTDWLKTIQAHQVESRQYEFSPLVQVQGWSEVPRKLPLFESIYIFENYLGDALGMENFGNVRVRDIQPIAHTNYPLTLMVYQGQRLLLKLFYDSSRFDHAVTSRILDHLHTVLESMVADPHRRISDVEILTDAERERLIGAAGEVETEERSQTCLHRLFESQAEQTPLAPALIFEQTTLTYEELNTRANRLAHHLQSLGVGPEVIVGVCLPRSVEMVVALLGILKAGGAYLPLDPAYPSQRLSFMVRDSRMRVLVTQPGLTETLDTENVQVVHLEARCEALPGRPATNLSSEVSAENLAYVIYTSGSTGTPKGVQIPHAAVINLLLSMRCEPGLDATDTLLAVTTLSFDIAALEIFLTLITGAQLALASREMAIDAAQLSSALERYNVTAMQATPATWRMLIESGWQPGAGLKVLCGGEALSRALADELLDRSDEVWNVYGPTETTIWSAIWRVTRQKNVPIGKPIARTQLYVLDERAQLVPEGVGGELYIGGLGLARGYRERSDLTAEKFVPNPYSVVAGARMYRTGDLVRRLPNGEIEYIARVDNQVKVRGFRIELGEIEAALEAHPSVSEAVAAVHEDARGDKRLVAYIVPNSETLPEQISDEVTSQSQLASPLVTQLRHFVAEKLPAYMIPAAFVLLTEMPLTPNGKIDRRQLAQLAPSAAINEQKFVAARTPTEELIAGVWQEVLGIERAGIDNDFFELGGHSLLAMQVTTRLRDAFKLELPLRLLFGKPTIRTLAQAVEEEFKTGRKLEAPPIEILSREERLPLSFAQQRLWFLDQMEPGNPFYNLGGAVRLRGPLDIAALKKSFDEVLRRHEVLRASFTGSGEDVRQIIASQVELQLPVVDLEHFEPDERENEIQRLAVEEAQRPFDLGHGPLLRTTLLRLAEDEHVVLFTMHHIVSDEWSIGLLIHEISICYEAFSLGQPALLPELKVQYADYAGWQQRWLGGETIETILFYWKKQLDGAPLVLDLPAEGARPPVQTYQGATYQFELGAALTEKLKTSSRQQGATLFMTLLAAFQTLVYRYTGQEDFVIGTPVANRSRQELESLIGFFVNLLVLRCELTAGMTFTDHLRRVRETALDAYAHQDLPFEKLVEELQPERDLSRSPVFQVLFALQNAPVDLLSPDLAGVEMSPMEIERGISRYDLGVSIIETKGSLYVAFEYNTQLFTASRMRRMAEHYTNLLENIVAEPQKKIEELELIGAEERRLLLGDFNQTVRGYSREACVHELVEQHAEKRPKALALTYQNEQLTFGEWNERANRLAHYLRRLGVGPEVMVGICVERSLDWVVALLGILKAGGAYVALDPGYPADRLAYMLHDSNVPVLVTQERLRPILPATPTHLICLDSDSDPFAHESDENPEPLARAENLAYVTYTSGSTGRPKAVMTTHGSLLNLVFAHRREFKVTEDDRSPQFAQMGFDASVWELWTYLTAGASVHVADDETRLSPAKLRQWFVDQQITIGWLPPVLAETVLDDDWPETLSLQLLITGSDKARRHPPSSLPFAYVNSYGPTEATVIVTWGTVPLKANSDSAPLIGRPIDNTQIYMLDRQLRPVPIGVPGELCIGGASLGRGYLNWPDLTAAKFIPDAFGPVPGMRLYRTGDLARYNEEGNIEFLGRIDDQVKVRGFRIELGEIETVLAEHPNVRTALVLVDEDSANDKRLIAYVVPQEQPTNDAGKHSYELTSRLAQHLREKLPAYMAPSAFVLLKEMPLSPNGKLNRRLLPSPDETGLISPETCIEPRTALEQTVADIFKKVLKLEQAGVYDNFFELGGHSLLATQVVSQIREQFDVELSLRSLFGSPTVAGIAELVASQSNAQSTAGAPIKPVSRLRPLPLSFAQQRLWFLDRLESGNTAYNVPLAVRLSGSLNLEVLKRTLSEVVRRHEILRTTLAEVDGEPRQIIAPPSPVSVLLLDLCELAKAEREAAVQRHVDEATEQQFDLARGPLLKIELLKLAEDEHVLILTMHHIITDGWSMGVLIDEVGALYQAFAAGRATPLKDLRIQYADYAVWERQRLQGDVLQELLDYWRGQLAGAPALELPTDRPRPARQSYRGARLAFELTRDLTEKLYDFSQRESVTLFMTLLSAWQTLLARYSGQWDITVGTPIANRTRSEVEGLIGFFVNTLVLRMQMNAMASFREQLQQVREVCLGAYAHQDVPFERVVEELQPERDLSRSPLFQVLFELQNAPLGYLELQGLKLEPLVGNLDTTKFDLTLTAMEAETGLQVWLEYNTDLFEEPTVARMFEHWRGLLEAAVAQPEQSLTTLPMLTEAEQQQLLAWNDTDVDYPRDGTLTSLFTEQARRTPVAVAVEHEGVQLSYAELNRRANRLANHLRRLGVGPEVRVGLSMDRSPELVVGLLGVMKAGGAYVPLDREYPLGRLRFMIEDAQLRLVLTKESSAFAKAGVQVIDLTAAAEEIGKESEAEPESGVTADNLAYVIYTSGSTGTPKGVEVDHRAVLRTVLNTDYIQVTPEDRVAQAANTAFDASTFEVWATLLNGATSVVLDKETVLGGEKLAVAIRERQISVLYLTAALFHHMAQVAPGAFAPLRAVLFGGETVDPRWVRAVLHDGSPERLLHMYGPTEVTVFSTWKMVTELADDASTVSIGRSTTNTESYVLDEWLQLSPVGVNGELYHGGDGLARGYLNRPELTAERFVPNPYARRAGERLYRTGDIVRYHPNGELEFVGRRDAQVKVRGYRIELGEIETVLTRHPQVRQAVMVVREPEPGNKQLVAYVAGEVVVSELRSYLKEKLPEYMAPQLIVTLESLPLTRVGKIDRQALPSPDTAVLASEDYVAPRTATEQTLVEIFRKVLKLEEVGVYDNFFELGGHSLLATQVVSQIRERFALELSLRSFFTSPTVADVAQIIESGFDIEGGAQGTQIKAASRLHPLPLSFAQQGLWLTDRLDPGGTAYNVPLAVRLSGSLDVEVLRRTLNEVVRRHEILRTTLAEIDGEPRQIIAPPSAVSVPLIDLSELEEAEQQAELRRHMEQAADERFDLARGPLLKIELVKLADDEHVLIMTLHHIITDGWSTGVLINEVGAIYEAFVSRRESPLPELPIQYADYAIWQRQRLQGEVLEELLDYWRVQLAGAPALNLPADYSREADQEFRSASLPFTLTPELTAALKEISWRENVTLFMTLLACWQLLLARYTGQEDIVVTSPIANRTQVGFEGLIGLFVNLLVLRTQVSSELTFLELLGRVREVCFGAYAHQELPFERLVEELQPERQSGQSPLFQVLFQVQNIPAQELKLPGLRLSALPIVPGPAKVDLTLTLSEFENVLFGEFTYSQNLASDSIVALERQWRALLESVVDNPDCPISALAMGTEQEYAELIDSFNEQLEV